MALNTDLALEAFEDATRAGKLEGVVSRKRYDKLSGFTITETEITTSAAAKRLGKPTGRYVTLVPEVPLWEYSAGLSGRISTLARELQSVCGDTGRVLFAGLGNRRMTADCIGPLAADRVLATRHFKRLPLEIDTSGMSETTVIAAGVTAQTGLESAEITAAVCSKVSPSQVIVCDALACADPRNMGKSIQISSSGIAPGSGVGNSRQELSKRTLGVRVASIGVPTVSRLPDSEMLVMPRCADSLAEAAASLIAAAVNHLLYPAFTDEEIASLIGS